MKPKAAAPRKRVGFAQDEEPVKAAAPRKRVGFAQDEEPVKVAAPRKRVGFAQDEEPVKAAVPRKRVGFAQDEELLKAVVPRKRVGFAGGASAVEINPSEVGFAVEAPAKSGARKSVGFARGDELENPRKHYSQIKTSWGARKAGGFAADSGATAPPTETSALMVNGTSAAVNSKGKKVPPRWGPTKEIVQGGRFRLLQAVVINAPRHTGWPEDLDALVVGLAAPTDRARFVRACGEDEQVTYEIKLESLNAAALYHASRVEVVSTSTVTDAETIVVPEGWLRPKGVLCSSTDVSMQSVASILHSHRYRMPLFQRRYCWAGEQWAGLWASVEKLATELRDSTNDNTGSGGSSGSGGSGSGGSDSSDSSGSSGSGGSGGSDSGSGRSAALGIHSLGRLLLYQSTQSTDSAPSSQEECSLLVLDGQQVRPIAKIKYYKILQ
jgi:hypothetical protein